MQSHAANDAIRSTASQTRTNELFAEQCRKVHTETHHIFIALLVLQWVGGIATAVIVSPTTWIGDASQVHVHLWASIVLGGIISSLPIFLALRYPQQTITRHVIAVSQMLWSVLLIHLSGGRIETHFHVFGSLAFLAFYRDWKVLATATVVVCADHAFRGIFWPQSVFGLVLVSPYRWIEHGAWVLFIDVFLVISCRRGVSEMRDLCHRQSLLEDANLSLETKVLERTAELKHANSELESSNVELKQFAYIASHDLQAPLRSIHGFADVLQQEYGSDLNEEASGYLERIVKASRRLQSLINDLLSYSRVDSEAAGFGTVALNEVFDDVLQLLSNPIEESNGIVTRDDELPAVVGDRGQLVQLMQNLIGNGIKYHGLQAPRVHVSADIEATNCRIGVTDNGIGIAKQHQERVFEIFRRLHSPAAYPGTGIGLAVCRRIVTRHDGRIWIESEEGVGTTICFTLRAADEEQVTTAPGSATHYMSYARTHI